MKTKQCTFKILSVFILTLIVCLFNSITPTYALAMESSTDENVYLVWKESDFKKNTDYLLTDDNNDGEYEYTFEVETDSRLLSYYIEYQDEKYYPNEDGAVDLEKGTYSIYFNPNALYGLYNTKVEEINRYYLMCQDNNYTKNEDYVLNLNEDNTSFDEYIITVSFTEPKTYSFYVRDMVDKIDYYSNEDHYVEIEEVGTYEVLFSPVYSYEGYKVKISKSEEEIYYLMCKDNNYTMNTSYELKFDDESDKDYDEYIYEISFLEEIDFVYYIYASKEKIKYYPNNDGFVTIEEEGDYKVVFSPIHSYYSDSDENYYTTVELKEDYFPEADYYFLSAKNGYEVCEENKLELNENNLRFDEYILNIEFDGATNLAYYIYVVEKGETTGINYYPNETGVFKIKEAGLYVIKFSLTHSYESNDDEMFYTTIHKADENPIYYLMNIDNDFTINEDYILTLNEENTDFDEYICEFETTKDSANYAYFIYDAELDKRYYPNRTGVVYLEYIDKYIVRFSPTYSYNTDSNGNKYHTSVELKEQDLGGYFIIGNLNNYTYKDDEEFKENYMLGSVPLNSEQAGYDYYIELDITAKMIKEYGTIKYYITDGYDRYRGVDKCNFVISEPGKYAIYFAEPSTNNDSNVYYYALKKYDSIEEVSELMFLDQDDNNVYVSASGLTSDMEAKLVTRGKYSYIEITQNGKLLSFDNITVTYYVGNNASDYNVKIFSNKNLEETQTEYLNQFVVFNYNSGEGFIIEKIPEGLSPIIISLIVSAGFIVASITIISIVSLNKKKKAKHA